MNLRLLFKGHSLITVSSLAIILMLTVLPHAAVGDTDGKPRILFDESHSPMIVSIAGDKISLTIKEGFSSLASGLTSVGFQVESAEAGSISSRELKEVSIVVLPPSSRVLSSTEENAIVDFVRKGGGLLLLGENSYDGHTSLARRFGITPVKAVICDPLYSLPIRPFHIRVWNTTSYDITEGVHSYIFDWGQPLVVKSPAFALAFVGNQSWMETDYDGLRESGERGGDIVALAAAEYNSGRVVVTGDATGFANFDVINWNGLEQFDTMRLVLNIFNWLGQQELFGISLSYLVSIDLDTARNHRAHVELNVEHVNTPVLTFAMYKWHDSQYYQMPITDLSAFDITGMSVEVEFKAEGLRRFWTVQVGQATSLSVKYDVTLNFVREDFNQYTGYLGQKFGMSEGAGVFLLPDEAPIADVKVSFNLPQGWEAFAPWKKMDNAFVPESTKSLMWSTFAVGPFTEFIKPIGDTNVRIATYSGWHITTQELLADYSFRMYDYMAKLFGRSAPLETYLTVWTPNAEDGRGICELEWSTSQGLVTNPPPNVNYNEYAHRVFHIWNAFEPTGMAMNSSEESWFCEGTNVYYNDKAVVQLGIKCELTAIAYYLNEYLAEYVGTEFDVPLVEAYKYADWANFNKYNWLYYHKGALVSYLLDEAIMKVTGGDRSLDDVLKIVYARYGGFKGAIANDDIIQILTSVTAFDFSNFFERFIFGTERLPLKIEGAGLTIDWPELMTMLKLAGIPIIKLHLSKSEVKLGDTLRVDIKILNVNEQPLSGQAVNIYLDDMLIGVYTTGPDGSITVQFKVTQDPGIHRIVVSYPGSPSYKPTKIFKVLIVKPLASSLTLVIPITVTQGESISLNAILVDEFGSPIEDATVDFYINVDDIWTKIGSAQTNAQGIASINYMFDKAGVFQLKATYSGVVKYKGGEATAPITVTAVQEVLPTAIPYDLTYLVAVGAVVVGVVTILLAKRRSKKSQLETT